MNTLQGCPEGKLECDWGEVAITNGASLSRSLFGIEYIFYPIIKENSQFLLSYSREGNCLLVLQSTYTFLSQSHFLISFQTYSYHRSNHKTLRTLSVPRARLLQQCGSFLAFHSIIITSRKVTVSVLPSWGQFFCWHIPRPNQECSQLSQSNADSFRFLKLLWDLDHNGTAQPSQLSEQKYLCFTDWERRAKRNALICPHSKMNIKNKIFLTSKCFSLYIYY